MVASIFSATWLPLLAAAGPVLLYPHIRNESLSGCWQQVPQDLYYEPLSNTSKLLAALPLSCSLNISLSLVTPPTRDVTFGSSFNFSLSNQFPRLRYKGETLSRLLKVKQIYGFSVAQNFPAYVVIPHEDGPNPCPAYRSRNNLASLPQDLIPKNRTIPLRRIADANNNFEITFVADAQFGGVCTPKFVSSQYFEFVFPDIHLQGQLDTATWETSVTSAFSPPQYSLVSNVTGFTAGWLNHDECRMDSKSILSDSSKKCFTRRQPKVTVGYQGESGTCQGEPYYAYSLAGNCVGDNSCTSENFRSPMTLINVILTVTSDLSHLINTKEVLAMGSILRSSDFASQTLPLNWCSKTTFKTLKLQSPPVEDSFEYSVVDFSKEKIGQDAVFVVKFVDVKSNGVLMGLTSAQFYPVGDNFQGLKLTEPLRRVVYEVPHSAACHDMEMCQSEMLAQKEDPNDFSDCFRPKQLRNEFCSLKILEELQFDSGTSMERCPEKPNVYRLSQVPDAFTGNDVVVDWQFSASPCERVLLSEGDCSGVPSPSVNPHKKFLVTFETTHGKACLEEPSAVKIRGVLGELKGLTSEISAEVVVTKQPSGWTTRGRAGSLCDPRTLRSYADMVAKCEWNDFVSMRTSFQFTAVHAKDAATKGKDWVCGNHITIPLWKVSPSALFSFRSFVVKGLPYLYCSNYKVRVFDALEPSTHQSSGFNSPTCEPRGNWSRGHTVNVVLLNDGTGVARLDGNFSGLVQLINENPQCLLTPDSGYFANISLTVSMDVEEFYTESNVQFVTRDYPPDMASRDCDLAAEIYPASCPSQTGVLGADWWCPRVCRGDLGEFELDSVPNTVPRQLVQHRDLPDLTIGVDGLFDGGSGILFDLTEEYHDHFGGLYETVQYSNGERAVSFTDIRSFHPMTNPSRLPALIRRQLPDLPPYALHLNNIKAQFLTPTDPTGKIATFENLVATSDDPCSQPPNHLDVWSFVEWAREFSQNLTSCPASFVLTADYTFDRRDFCVFNSTTVLLPFSIPGAIYDDALTELEVSGLATMCPYRSSCQLFKGAAVAPERPDKKTLCSNALANLPTAILIGDTTKATAWTIVFLKLDPLDMDSLSSKKIHLRWTYQVKPRQAKDNYKVLVRKGVKFSTTAGCDLPTPCSSPAADDELGMDKCRAALAAGCNVTRLETYQSTNSAKTETSPIFLVIPQVHADSVISVDQLPCKDVQFIPYDTNAPLYFSPSDLHQLQFKDVQTRGVEVGESTIVRQSGPFIATLQGSCGPVASRTVQVGIKRILTDPHVQAAIPLEISAYIHPVPTGRIESGQRCLVKGFYPSIPEMQAAVKGFPLCETRFEAALVRKDPFGLRVCANSSVVPLRFTGQMPSGEMTGAVGDLKIEVVDPNQCAGRPFLVPVLHQGGTDCDQLMEQNLDPRSSPPLDALFGLDLAQCDLRNEVRLKLTGKINSRLTMKQAENGYPSHLNTSLSNVKSVSIYGDLEICGGGSNISEAAIANLTSRHFDSCHYNLTTLASTGTFEDGESCYRRALYPIRFANPNNSSLDLGELNVTANIIRNCSTLVIIKGELDHNLLCPADLVPTRIDKRVVSFHNISTKISPEISTNVSTSLKLSEKLESSVIYLGFVRAGGKNLAWNDFCSSTITSAKALLHRSLRGGLSGGQPSELATKSLKITRAQMRKMASCEKDDARQALVQKYSKNKDTKAAVRDLRAMVRTLPIGCGIEVGLTLELTSVPAANGYLVTLPTYLYNFEDDPAEAAATQLNQLVILKLPKACQKITLGMGGPNSAKDKPARNVTLLATSQTVEETVWKIKDLAFYTGTGSVYLSFADPACVLPASASIELSLARHLDGQGDVDFVHAPQDDYHKNMSTRKSVEINPLSPDECTESLMQTGNLATVSEHCEGEITTVVEVPDINLLRCPGAVRFFAFDLSSVREREKVFLLDSISLGVNATKRFDIFWDEGSSTNPLTTLKNLCGQSGKASAIPYKLIPGFPLTANVRTVLHAVRSDPIDFASRIRVVPRARYPELDSTPIGMNITISERLKGQLIDPNQPKKWSLDRLVSSWEQSDGKGILSVTSNGKAPCVAVDLIKLSAEQRKFLTLADNLNFLNLLQVITVPSDADPTIGFIDHSEISQSTTEQTSGIVDADYFCNPSRFILSLNSFTPLSDTQGSGTPKIETTPVQLRGFAKGKKLLAIEWRNSLGKLSAKERSVKLIFAGPIPIYGFANVPHLMLSGAQALVTNVSSLPGSVQCQAPKIDANLLPQPYATGVSKTLLKDHCADYSFNVTEVVKKAFVVVPGGAATQLDFSRFETTNQSFRVNVTATRLPESPSFCPDAGGLRLYVLDNVDRLGDLGDLEDAMEQSGFPLNTNLSGGVAIRADKSRLVVKGGRNAAGCWQYISGNLEVTLTYLLARNSSDLVKETNEYLRRSVIATPVFGRCINGLSVLSTAVVNMENPLHTSGGILGDNSLYCVYKVRETIGPLASTSNLLAFQVDLISPKFRPNMVRNVQVELSELAFENSPACSRSHFTVGLYLLTNVNSRIDLFGGLSSASEQILWVRRGSFFVTSPRVVLKGSTSRVVMLFDTVEAACYQHMATTAVATLEYIVPTGTAQIEVNLEVEGRPYTLIDEDEEDRAKGTLHVKTSAASWLSLAVTLTVGLVLLVA